MNWGFSMGFGWVVPIVVIVILVYLLKESSLLGNKEKDARELLDERYAKGEIDEQEYQRKKEQLLQ